MKFVEGLVKTEIFTTISYNIFGCESLVIRKVILPSAKCYYLLPNYIIICDIIFNCLILNYLKRNEIVITLSDDHIC